MTIIDDELGEVVVRRNALSRGLRFSVAPSGKFTVSAPLHISDWRLKRLIPAHRADFIRLRDLSGQAGPKDPSELATLRKKAKYFLPRRLMALAKQFDFSYASVRCSHASTRWGSCTSKGVVSLNIGLMRLPDQLRDYVLIHELCHTRHLNHSPAFWAEVERCDPGYKLHRKMLKNYQP